MPPDTSSILFLLIVAIVPIVWATLCLFRKPYTPLQWILYFINVLFVRCLWRAELPESLPVPEEHGAVIICNHRSSIDPCFFQVVAGRRLVHWLVAQMFPERSLIGRLLKQFEVIPVRKRGTDNLPTKAAIRAASNGELVGMLPEGRINTTDEFMLKVRPGAVLVALKAHVPILPCFIEGSPYHDTLWRPVLMPARVRLKVGQLIDLSEFFGREREDGVLQRLTLKCVKEIAKLAGREDFEPQLAGRDWKTWQ